MGEINRLSYSTLLVLKAFIEQPRTALSGADVVRNTSLRSGTLYPILLRLERQEILSSKWEDGEPEQLGRPRRRYYSLTTTGAAVARNALSQVAVPLTAFLPSPESAS